MPFDLPQVPNHMVIRDEINDGMSAYHRSHFVPYHHLAASPAPRDQMGGSFYDAPTKTFNMVNNEDNFIDIDDGSQSGNLLMLDNDNQPVEPPYPFNNGAMSMASSNYNVPGGRQVTRMSNMVEARIPNYRSLPRSG